MTRNAEGAPVREGPFDKNVQQHCRAGTAEDATRRVPVASATSYPPAGRRRFTLLLVLHCPFCRLAHAHRGAERGGLRQSGCGRGPYLVKPATGTRVPA
jgi:hypothetical protein